MAVTDSPQGLPSQTLLYRWADNRRYWAGWAAGHCEETTARMTLFTCAMHSGRLR